jgi:hypothetical protein
VAIEMKIPYVPDVEAAPWRHPYRFSGRLPLGALTLMVGVGVAAALVAGVAGYFGGAITHWMGVQAVALTFKAVDIGVMILTWVWSFHLIDLVGGLVILVVGFPVVVGVLSVAALLGGAVVIVAFGYPFLIGTAAGLGVVGGARTGKSRRPWVAAVLGYLAGSLAYAAFVETGVLINAPLHESSRMLEVLGPPASYALMVVDGLIVLIAAGRIARSVHETPYCEACDAWYGQPATATIPIRGATALVEAMESGSATPLETMPTRVEAVDRITLRLSHCTCDRTDYNLIATVSWAQVVQSRNGKSGSRRRTQTWFRTTLPAPFGAAMQGWLGSRQVTAAA